MPQTAEVIDITKKVKPAPLSSHVKETLEKYFAQLNGHETTGLHAMLISEVEKPLIKVTLNHCGQNQTKAAKILGLSRSTLRKKIEQYNIS
jgi:Fis family transcriptional regulator